MPESTTTDPEVRKRGGAGLFSLYRSLGGDAPQGGAGEGSAPAPSEAPAKPSRAAQLLQAAAPAKARQASAGEARVPNPLADESESLDAAGVLAGEAKDVVPKPVSFPDRNGVKDELNSALSEAMKSHRAERGQPGSAAHAKPIDAGAPAAKREAQPPHMPQEPNAAPVPQVATTKTPEESETPRSKHPRQARRPRRGLAAREPAGLDGVDARLIEARRKKQFKRRVRGEDYEQVTVIMDRELFVALDERLHELSESSGGNVKLSRSIFVRALLKRFLSDSRTRHQALSFAGLFTPDPRSPEELEVVEEALVERLGA